MKVCIIGSGGFVGSALATVCMKRGDSTQLVSSRLIGGIDPITGLLPTDFQVAPGTDAVYYLAQSPHYRDMPAYAAHLLSVNCVSAVQAAAAAVRAGAKRFIYASTGNVYAPAFGPLSEDAPVSRDAWYPLSKLMAEEALRLYNAQMHITAVRIFAIYGPRQQGMLVPKLINSVRNGGDIFAERNASDETDLGGLRISPIYIDDAIAVLWKLASRTGPSVLNLGGNLVLSISEIAAMIGKELGIPAKVSISERSRTFNLICDTGLLQHLADPTFTSFEHGLRQTISSITFR